MRAVDPVIQAVRHKMLIRSAEGFIKYGVGLDRTDLTTLDWLIHAQEEAMDLAAYLERAIQDEMKIERLFPGMTIDEIVKEVERLKQLEKDTDYHG